MYAEVAGLPYKKYSSCNIKKTNSIFSQIYKCRVSGVGRRAVVLWKKLVRTCTLNLMWPRDSDVSITNRHNLYKHDLSIWTIFDYLTVDFDLNTD